jgi:hypothetical protein
MIIRNRALLCIVILSIALSSMAVFRCSADNDGVQSGRIDGSGYFRVEITTVGPAGNEEGKTKILVEAYELSELPKMSDLDERPDLKREIVSYLKQGFKYIKLEVTVTGANKSKKLELWKNRTKD